MVVGLSSENNGLEANFVAAPGVAIFHCNGESIPEMNRSESRKMFVSKEMVR